MADKKTSDLVAITAANVLDTDLSEISDLSVPASKKITIAEAKKLYGIVTFSFSKPDSTVPTSSAGVSTTTTNLVGFSATDQVASSGIVFNNTSKGIELPAGKHKINVTLNQIQMTSGAFIDFRLHDGTNFFGNLSEFVASASSFNQSAGSSFGGTITLASAGTVYIQCILKSGTITDIGTAKGSIDITTVEG